MRTEGVECPHSCMEKNKAQVDKLNAMSMEKQDTLKGSDVVLWKAWSIFTTSLNDEDLCSFTPAAMTTNEEEKKHEEQRGFESRDKDNDEGNQREEAIDVDIVGQKKVSFGKRIGSYFKSSEEDDGLTFRQRLAKMGLATVLSYGWISNTNAMILVSAAWYAFSAKVCVHT